MALKLSNTQYELLLKSYLGMRNAAEEIGKENRQLAYGRIPELSILDRKLIDATRVNSPMEVRAIATDIANKRRELLLKNGFPGDFLDVPYNCKSCKDTGFVKGERCKCFKNMMIKLLYSDPRWNATFDSENFDNFDLSFYEGMTDPSGNDPKTFAMDALAKSKEFLNDVIHNTGAKMSNLIITGNPGTGKTFLCNCIARELIENDFFTVYLTAPELFLLFNSAVFSKKQDFSGAGDKTFNVTYNNIYDCDILIIDDLGTEYSNSATAPLFFDLINSRLLDRKPTLISTNLSIEELKENYTERVLSRITGNYRFIHLYGEDIRLKKRKLVSLKGA